MDFDPVCVDDCRTVVHGAGDRGGEGSRRARQLVLVGVIELIYWNVWAAFTPLVIALAKRFPLTGPRFISHIAIHTIASFLMAPLASVTEYFLSHGLLGLLFRITDPGAPRPLPTFTGRLYR